MSAEFTLHSFLPWQITFLEFIDYYLIKSFPTKCLLLQDCVCLAVQILPKGIVQFSFFVELGTVKGVYKELYY